MLETKQSAVAAMPRIKRSGEVLRQARQLHLYLGTFFAPAILFFSLTGAVQIFSLHEGRPGSSYQPPVWLEKLAQVHKKQTLAIRPRGPAKTGNAGLAKAGPPEAPRPLPPSPNARSTVSMYVLKWFSFLMSIGLVTTTVLGIYMAFKYNRDKRLIWGLLLVGTALPAVLAALSV